MINHDKMKRNMVSVARLILLLSVPLVLTLSGCSKGSSEDFTISGVVTSGGSALSGVRVTLSGDSSEATTTDSNGALSFVVSNYGPYTVPPSLAGYTFSPPYRTATIVGINGNAFNFTGYSPSSVATSLHTVYLRNDGTVWTWGSNSNGRLVMELMDLRMIVTPL